MIRFQITFLLLFGWCVSALAYNTDTLLHQYQHSTNDSVRLRAMINLAWQYRNTDAERSIHFADEAAILAIARGDTSALASAYLRKALTLRKRGRFDEALLLNQNAVELKQTIRDTLGLALALGNLSQLHKSMGNFEQAVTLRIASIKWLSPPQYAKHRMKGYNNLASIYASLKEHSKAMEQYNRCLSIAQQLDDSTTLARTWYNLGATHQSLLEYDTAEYHYQRALLYATQHQDALALARLYNSLGSLQHLKRNANKALALFEQAKTLYAQLGFTPELIMVYNNIAAVHQQQGRFDVALTHYRKSASMADSIGIPNDLEQVYFNFSETYERRSMPDSALHYYKLYSTVKDSLFNAEKNRQILEVQEKFETAEKDKSIAELNQVQMAQQADIQLRNVLLVGAGFFSLLLLVVGINYYQKLQVQRKLAAQEAELSRQSMVEVLKDSELKSINAFIDGETSERQRIASELHDNLGSRLATVKLHYDHLIGELDSDSTRSSLLTANNLLGETLGEVRQLAQHLTAGVLNKFGLVSATEDLCKAISASGALTLSVDAFELEDRLSPALELTLFRTLQELVSNIVKHARATEANIQLIRYEDHIHIMVTDNGRGFSTMAPSVQQGFGLRSIEARIADLGGSFTIDTQPNHGTTCIIEIPI